MPNFR